MNKNTPAFAAASDPVVDTYDWDTAFALNFDNANAALVNNWPNVNAAAKAVRQTASDMPSFSIDGTFKPWQLVAGGDGKNIRMRCTFDSGTYAYEGGSLDLAKGDGQPVSAIIEVGMEWVPEPNQKFFVINDNPKVNSIKTALDDHETNADLKTAFSDNGVTLASGAVITPKQPGKEWLIENGADDDFYIFLTTDKFGTEYLQVYKFQDDWENVLQLLSEAVSESEPAVTIISVAGDSDLTAIPRAALEEMLSTWFTDNIGEFNHVFASINLSPTLAATAKYAWIKPTGTGYAVVDEGASDDSIFGVLNTVLQHEIPANHQVSPNIIPAKSQAGYAISGTNFVQQMLLPAAMHAFDDAPASAFKVLNDGLTVTNTETVVWGKFMMDEKKKGTIDKSYATELDKGGDVSNDLQMAVLNAGLSLPDDAKISVTSKGDQWLLSDAKEGSVEAILDVNGDSIEVFEATVIKIDKGNFKMSLVNSYVEIEFIDLYYPYSSNFDVHVNFTEQVEMKLQEKGGKKIFWFDQIEKNMTVTVTKTKIAITRQIVEGAITAVLALVAIAGPVIEGLSEAAEVTDLTEEGADVEISAESFESAEDSDPTRNEEDEEDAGKKAATTSKGKLTNIKNAFRTTKWKIMGAIMATSAAISGLDLAISGIIELAAKDEWQKVPGFDLFANTLIEPYSFPGISGFELESAHLQQSLVVGFNVTPKS